jgi:hypothetical protein
VEAIIKQLAGKVGEVVDLEMRAIATVKGEFYRARVKLDASQPLTRCFTLWDNFNHAIMILLNWRYAIPTHMSVTVVAPTCQ